uniref:Uncharacterized protein n=1 Tax=Glossina brevipalpis TaxID=37001 RepID=A0A1A9WRZ3_9MUSC
MSTDDNCLILHCSTDKIVEVLKQAKELNIMLREYQTRTQWTCHIYILTVGANITTVRVMDPIDFHMKNKEHENREKRYYRVDSKRAKISVTDNYYSYFEKYFEIIHNSVQ